MNLDDITRNTGDSCDYAGLYWASGCGHADCIDIEEGAVFPPCEMCGHKIVWIHYLVPVRPEFLPNHIRRYRPDRGASGLP